MSQERSEQFSLAQFREIMDKVGGERGYDSRQEMKATSGQTFIMNLSLRCRRQDGKQYSYAKVWLTEDDGTTPFAPNTLYLWLTAKSSVLSRDIKVSQLERMLIEDIESGTVGYVVSASATAYDENSDPMGEISDSLGDCATP